MRSDTITFSAEIIKVVAKKTGLDKTFTLTLITDQDITALQRYIATEPVVIEVKEVK